MTSIVFDLDGTLIDSAPDLHAAAIRMLAEADLPEITFDQTRSFIGNGVPVLVRRIMTAAGLPEDPDRHAEMEAAFLRHYNAAPADLTVLYPGVEAALDRLEAAGCVFGLCTNKPEGPTRDILRAFGLAERMQVVVGGDTLPVKKPDPAPLHRAFAAMPDGPQLYVGDSEVDAATARAAGIRFALFSGGYRKSPVDEMLHDHLFDHWGDLPGMIG
ncbi:phosphoglycolate phosphatase [Meridianimarinicoccus sp. RP-17]|uniref:phosphoglycolate phosphatase n=1 Tax=Meridianimarinicoccus zhengii TaxID=2056810 RepID=UPI000DABC926|nr:phosphoglycolate phosphatase [Phycocomes zhengii]